MKSSDVFFGIVFVFAAGAVTGILFAPEKGWKTRRDIAEKGEDYTESVMDAFKGFMDAMNKQYHNAMREVDTLASKGKHGIDMVDSAVKSNLQHAHNQHV